MAHQLAHGLHVRTVANRVRAERVPKRVERPRWIDRLRFCKAMNSL